MNKLKMHSINKVDENIEKIGKLFPNCLTERKNEFGEVEYAVDFDMLKQELSSVVIDGNEERYQFTWPDKRKSILLANAPIAKTLRPCREESVDFDNTENLYIEGDNLEVLKLLQETYLGKVKMIYIDPPYNTGNDFVYEDDFAQNTDEYMANSGQYDEEGNRLVKNLDSNGRFHTDWLNMIYPRLKLAKDLLTDDGVIFISIDDNEVENLKKICDEIFGIINFLAVMIRRSKSGAGHDSKNLAVEHEYCLAYCKNTSSLNLNQEIIDTEKDSKYKFEDEFTKRRGRYYIRDLDYKGSYSQSLDYPIITPNGNTIWSGGKQGAPNTWRWSKEKFEWGKQNGFIVFKENKVYIKQYQFVDNNDDIRVRTIPYRAYMEYLNGEATQEVSVLLGNAFSYPKPVSMIKYLLKIATNKNDIILDFFSGSATTAHAVMQLNAEDGGNRKFIMVQLPEETDEKSEAYKEGYKNICEIGKERIRRAGKKILSEFSQCEVLSVESGVEGNEKTIKNSTLQTPNSKLDTGFRVLKCDSSNMKEVYYNPADYTPHMFDNLTDNIKSDRTPQDLLFQVMLDLGILLSSEIKSEVLSVDSGVKYTYYNVADNYLIACFDENITDEVVTEIAKKKPYYFVMRDSSLASDSVAVNFEQIFKTYSPDTVRKVL